MSAKSLLPVVIPLVKSFNPVLTILKLVLNISAGNVAYVPKKGVCAIFLTKGTAVVYEGIVFLTTSAA